MDTGISIKEIAKIEGVRSSDMDKLNAASAAIFELAKSHANEIEVYADYRRIIDKAGLASCNDHLAAIRHSQSAVDQLYAIHRKKGESGETCFSHHIEKLKTLTRTAEEQVAELTKCVAR